MSFLDLANKRYSVRNYKKYAGWAGNDDAIPYKNRKTLDEILSYNTYR